MSLRVGSHSISSCFGLGASRATQPSLSCALRALSTLASVRNPHWSQVPLGRCVTLPQEKWSFPTSHLPIGMFNAPLTSINPDVWSIASWNVGGRVSEAKEIEIVHHVTEGLLSHPTYPKSIVVFQECNASLLKWISQLARNCGATLIIGGDTSVIFIDPKKLHLLEVTTYPTRLSLAPCKVLDTLLQEVDTGRVFRFLHPSLAGPYGLTDFAEYLTRKHYEVPTLVIGDFGANECRVDAALNKAFCRQGGSPFSRHTTHCTTIRHDVLLEHDVSVATSHILFSDPAQPTAAHGASIAHFDPEMVLPGLTSFVKLLS